VGGDDNRRAVSGGHASRLTSPRPGFATLLWSGHFGSYRFKRRKLHLEGIQGCGPRGHSAVTWTDFQAQRRG
jgi:hypothetical protein